MEEVKRRLEKFKEESRGIRREVREKTVSYIVASLGLVAGLAWNEAIKALIEYMFPISKNTLFAKFAYASIVTLIVVVLTINVAKLLNTGEKEREQER